MTLLERQPLIDRLQALVMAAAAGRGNVAMLSGEAGVGKSTLARALVDTAGPNVRKLWGACEDLSPPEPLGPLFEISRTLSLSLQSVLSQSGRLGAFSALAERLAEGDTGCLLVIEDLHWADDATIDFIRYLGRRIARLPVLLLLTARSDEAAARGRVRRALADIPAELVSRIEVPLLTENAVNSLALRAGLDGASIYRMTSGNAFHVTELVRAAGLNALPASLSDAVLARADRLSPAARAALDAISIFPRKADPRMIDALLGHDSAPAIGECMAAGILLPSDPGCAFRHEVARRAVEAALSAAQRRDLNARALRLLEDVGAAVTRLAYHAREAQDEALIRRYAPVAGEEAARLGAHREAAEHFRAAILHADTFEPGERIQLYRRFAFESHLIGRMKPAIEAQKQALEICRKMGDHRGEGDGLRWLSRLSYLDGNRIDADRFGREAVARLEAEPPGVELAMAFSNLSQLAMLASDVDDAVSWGEKAIALAGRDGLDEPAIVCHALNNVGSALVWRDPARARKLLDRSLEMAVAHGFPEHAARAYTNKGWLQSLLFEDVEAGRTLEAGIAYCRESDLDTWRDYMSALLADIHLRQGRWDDAAATAQRVVTHDDATALARYPASLVLARLRTRRGDPVDGLLTELARYLETGKELQRLAPYATLMAERAWLGLEEREVASALLEEALTHADAAVQYPDLLWWSSLLGRPVSMPADVRLQEPYASLVAGAWQEAAQFWQNRGAPYEQALALLSGGPAERQRALRIFETLGASPAARRQRFAPAAGAEASIHRRGARASTQSNAWGLTRREVDVLKLVDEGLSNAQIGSKLFISAKTVDHHISSILAKIGAKSRGEAAAMARKSVLGALS